MGGQRYGYACLLIGCVLGLAPVTTAATFKELLQRVPPSANALVAVDVDRVAESPYAVRQHWMDKDAIAYVDTPIVLPANASKIIFASQFDLTTGESPWRLGVADMKRIPPMDQIAKAEGGRVEKLAGVEAVWSPRDAYFIKLSPRLLAMVAPANRQYATRWIRFVQKGGVEVSDYLRSAIGYVVSGKADIVLAVDLTDAADPHDLHEEFKQSDKLKSFGVDLKALSEVVASIKGAALGIKIGDKPMGKAVVSFGKEPLIMKDFAREFVLETVSDMGAHVDDFDSFQGGVVGHTITLEGPFTERGLREVGSVLELPTAQGLAKADGAKDSSSSAQPSPGEEPSKAEKSLDYFKQINVFINDLRHRVQKDGRQFRASLWLDRYAQRIDGLPILNVDEDLVDFGASVSQRFRDISATADVTQANITASTTGLRVPAKTYSRGESTSRYAWGGGYGWGWGYGRSERNARRGQNLEARDQARINQAAAAAKERAKQLPGVLEIVNAIQNELSQVRRMLTERYKMEF